MFMLQGGACAQGGPLQRSGHRASAVLWDMRMSRRILCVMRCFTY